jgi:hypothetical protein
MNTLCAHLAVTALGRWSGLALCTSLVTAISEAKCVCVFGMLPCGHSCECMYWKGAELPGVVATQDIVLLRRAPGI